MYLYDIGVSGPEETYGHQYSHEKQFNQDELKEIIKEVMWEVIEKYCDDKKTIVSLDYDELHFSPYFREGLEKKGFSKLKFEESFYLFGPASAIEETGWHKSEGWTTNFDRDIMKSLGTKFKEKYKLSETDKERIYMIERK